MEYGISSVTDDVSVCTMAIKDTWVKLVKYLNIQWTFTEKFVARCRPEIVSQLPLSAVEFIIRLFSKTRKRIVANVPSNVQISNI